MFFTGRKINKEIILQSTLRMAACKLGIRGEHVLRTGPSWDIPEQGQEELVSQGARRKVPSTWVPKLIRGSSSGKMKESFLRYRDRTNSFSEGKVAGENGGIDADIDNIVVGAIP